MSLSDFQAPAQLLHRQSRSVIQQLNAHAQRDAIRDDEDGEVALPSPGTALTLNQLRRCPGQYPLALYLRSR